jgi:BolA protein
LTNRAERIRAALEAKFSPLSLDVIDESALHQGHAGARPGGETHYRVRIAATSLSSLPRLARHRAVNEALAPEFDTGLHALALEIGG